MEETLFYALGIGLVLAALLLSAVGLRSTTFPSKPLMALGVVAFVLLVGATMAASVINARDEQEKRRAELAGEAEGAKDAGAQAEGGGAAAGGTSVALAAPEDGTFAYDKASLEAAAGDLTIEFDNPALVQHDVVIERDGEEVAKSDLVSDGSTSVTAELEPGEYLFFCDVPGHREGGMEGTLSVQ